MRPPLSRPPFAVGGRTVLITGAARGIGAGVARRLHAAGANVALVGLEPDALERLAAELGDRAAWFEADVTDLQALQRAVTGTVARFGAVDIAIANAGISFIGARVGATLRRRSARPARRAAAADRPARPPQPRPVARAGARRPGQRRCVRPTRGTGRRG